MEQLIEKVKKILLTPSAAWAEIKAEETTIQSIIKNYLMYLVAIPVIATFIGRVFVGYPIVGPRIPFFRGLIWAVFAYVIYLVILYASALIVNALAPSFNAIKNTVSAFKLVAYSATASLVVSVVSIIPYLSPIALLGLIYSIYLFYAGLPVMMENPKEKTVPYAIVSILAMMVVGFILSGIVGLILYRY